MALTKIKISSLQAPGANAGTVLTVQDNQSIAANVSAAGGGGGSGVILLSNTNITENFDIPAGQNGLSIGPVTVDDNANVSIAPGQRWLIL
jgi:hypothetical protein